MLVGYARVSTEDQNLELQMVALRKAGAENVFTDKASAVTTRPGLDEALKYAREGDVLVVWKLDRLGRTVKGLIELVESLQGRGLQFRSRTEGIDTTTPAGRLFFHIVAAFAQMERELIRERTHAGLAAARARGRNGGRRRLMTDSKTESARRLLDSGMAAKEVAATLDVSVPTLYRALTRASQKGV